MVPIASVPSLVEHFSTAKTFRCYHVDYYEEYTDISDEEYRAALEAKRDEIRTIAKAFWLYWPQDRKGRGYTQAYQVCLRTSWRYIVDPVAARVAQQFEICRLCDKDRCNSVGIRFMSELIDQLLQQGRMVTAETDCGPGIRSA